MFEEVCTGAVLSSILYSQFLLVDPDEGQACPTPPQAREAQARLNVSFCKLPCSYFFLSQQQKSHQHRSRHLPGFHVAKVVLESRNSKGMAWRRNNGNQHPSLCLAYSPQSFNVRDLLYCLSTFLSFCQLTTYMLPLWAVSGLSRPLLVSEPGHGHYRNQEATEPWKRTGGL